ncbi:BTAD domain-containing putative transcriptional regulator [Roseibium sp. RKSG952]|uniref:BTAD domain-containing putative transcriptional regulator n=1 Tax=Roseibium sp. RKSG952 TaxID=2529384 RepID=UPI0018AD287D|nr:BTAD domain-containing putative transcriptional regulator [Roseibium sp. RKSG952]
MDSGHREILVRLMGRPRVCFPRKKPFPVKGYLLLANLLTSAPSGMTRQRAATLLWEETGQSRAMANLRQLLVRMQAEQPEETPLVTVSPTQIELGAGAARSDLAVFLNDWQSPDSQKKAAAIAEFGGDLLDGIEAEGEQVTLWLLSERANLRQKLADASRSALEDLTRFGRDKDRQIPMIADRLLGVEPDTADHYRAIARAYARCGDQASAARVLDRMAQVLPEEVKAQPSVPQAQNRSVPDALRASVDAAMAGAPEPAQQEKRVPRVAFAPLGGLGDLTQQTLAHAFVEDVANSLSRFRTFQVIAPHSSMKALASNDPALRAKIRFDFLVKGFLMPGTGRVSFTVIEEDSGEIVWSAEYALDPAAMQDTFRLVSKMVATNLAREIERHMLDTSGPDSPDAYVHLLRGQNLMKTCTLPMVRRARKEFRMALAFSQDFAIARARIAQTQNIEWLLLGGADPELLHQARAEAEAAIECDPAVGLGHWVAATTAIFQRDASTSVKKFGEAEALCPNSADLLIEQAGVLAFSGQTETAWRRFGHAVDLNPLAPDDYWWKGASIALIRREFREAIRLCKRMEDDEPALRLLTVTHALDGQLQQARHYARRLLDIYPGMSAEEMARHIPDEAIGLHDSVLSGLKLAGIK